MELSGSDASSAMTFGSDAEMPEDPIEEPIYLGRKREKFYKTIIERGEGIDKPGTIDEVVVRHCAFSENLSDQPFITLQLGQGNLPDYIERGIVSMKKNEIADFHVPETMTKTEALIVKVELFSFINIHDLHANKMLIKKVIQKSSGIDRINNKDEIVIKVTITQDNNILYEENNAEIAVGVTEMPEGMIEILKTMKIYEISEIQVNYDYFLRKFQYDTINTTDPIVKIEILNVLKVTDIYVNGGFYKKILEYGSTELVYPNSQIEFEYKLEYSDILLQGSLTAYLDESYLPSLWEDALKLMKIGEYAKIQCFENEKSQNLRDGLTEEFNCPCDTPVIYFRFLKVLSGGPVYEMDEPEKLNIALRMKKVGAELFKRNLYTRAIDKYDNGLGALNPVKDHLEMYKDTFISLQSNIALCFFKLKEYSKSIIRCDRILEVVPDESRAFYRKGMNLKMMFEFNSAIEIFEKGKSIAQEKDQQSNIIEFERELKSSKENLEAYHKKEKKIYANLFK